MNQSRSADIRPPQSIVPEMKNYNVDFARYHQVCQQVRVTLSGSQLVTGVKLSLRLISSQKRRRQLGQSQQKPRM